MIKLFAKRVEKTRKTREIGPRLTIVATCPDFVGIGSKRSARRRRCNARTPGYVPWRHVCTCARNQRRSSSSSSSVTPERLGLGRLSLSYWRLVVSWLVALFYYDYNSMPACTLYSTERPKRDYRLVKADPRDWIGRKRRRRRRRRRIFHSESEDRGADVSRLSRASFPVGDRFLVLVQPLLDERSTKKKIKEGKKAIFFLDERRSSL